MDAGSGLTLLLFLSHLVPFNSKPFSQIKSYMKPIIAAILLTPSIGLGSISLVFSDFNSALVNVANNAGDTGAAQNGLAWGIVIDTTGDNFSSPLAATVGLNVEDGATFGNGYFFYYGGTTVAIPGFADEPGDGSIGTSASMDVYASPGVEQDQSFAVIWFDSGLNLASPLSSGDNYGLEQNGAFLLPADGANNFSFAAASAGPDPLRTASLSLIPEPSTALLGLLGLAGLLRRKR